jgi:hypothetical protein
MSPSCTRVATVVVSSGSSIDLRQFVMHIAHSRFVHSKPSADVHPIKLGAIVIV